MERSFRAYQHVTDGVMENGGNLIAMRGCDGEFHADFYVVAFSPYDADGCPSFAEELITITRGFCDGVECRQECGDQHFGCGFLYDVSDDDIESLLQNGWWSAHAFLQASHAK